MAPKGQGSNDEAGFMTPEQVRDALKDAIQLQAAATQQSILEYNRAADERLQLMLAAMAQGQTAISQALIAGQQQQQALTTAIGQNQALAGTGGQHTPKHQPPTREPPKLDTTNRTVANFELYRAELAAHGGPIYIEAHKPVASEAAPSDLRLTSNTTLFGYILAGVADPEYKRLLIDAQQMADCPQNTASAALAALEKALLGDKEERDTRLVKEWEALTLGSERFTIFATKFKAFRTALRVAGMTKTDVETFIRLETALKTTRSASSSSRNGAF